jgi:hypothetical protein
VVEEDLHYLALQLVPVFVIFIVVVGVSLCLGTSPTSRRSPFDLAKNLLPSGVDNPCDLLSKHTHTRARTHTGSVAQETRTRPCLWL